MQNIFNYLHLIVFLDDNLEYFLVAFYVYITFLLFVLILFFIMSFRLKAGKYNILWPICILKYCLPIICKTFFGQIFILLISAFKCPEGRLYYNSKAPCTVGTWFYVGVPISCLAIIIQIVLSYVTISMYYQADFISEGNNLLKKRSSISDIIFLMNKIIFIIMFGFDKEKESEHWAIIFVACLITGFNVYGTVFLQYYENIIIKKFHYFYSLFLFWGFISLLVGKIFKSWAFNGAFYLFILGLIIIIIYCLFYAKTYLEFLHLNFNEINSSLSCINYIKGYLKVIKEKDISRDSSMILTTFIEKMEEGCTNKNCILKKYLISLSKGFDSNFILLQFAQRLFKIALNKFPKDVTLKLHYIMFLLTKINQKKNAKKELYSIKPNFIFLDENFKLYRCKKYLEEYNVVGNKAREETIENNDIFQALEYKNNTMEFKKLLSKSCYLYYDFWSSLYSSHLQGTEDIKKLNDIGAELNILLENIDKIFEKLREFKNNDLSIIKLYESYAKNILNNKEKYEKYYNISMNLVEDDKLQNKEIDFSNYDLNILNLSDEYKALAISANEENKGTIINITLNGCPIFGYHRNELIGKHFNILIPEVYHSFHNKLFNENTEKTKTEFFEYLSNNLIYTPKFLDFSVFGRNKSKYLIPLNLKLFFVQTEESDLAYIVKFDISKTFDSDLDENINTKCCVLTDNNFIIQTFTSNCVESLGLNSKIINSNYDITNYIKQFNEELQIMISSNTKDPSGLEVSERKSSDNSYREFNNSNNLNDKSFEHILKIKKKLLKKKFFYPRKISWNIYNNNINNYKELNMQTDIGKTQTSLFAPQGVKNKNIINEIEEKRILQKNFFMEVKEANFKNKHIGYYFYFKKTRLLKENIPNLLDKTKKTNTSLKSKANLKRPSVKFFNIDEESAKSSRIYKDDDDDENSILHKNSIGKVSIGSTKRNSIPNIEVENYHIRKFDSATLLNHIIVENDNNIDDKYIPKCNFNFYLDINAMSFKPSTKLDSNIELYQALRFQSIEKLNTIYKSKKKEKKLDSSSKTENSSYESNFSSNEYYSESNLFSSHSNSSSDNKNSKFKKTNTFKRKNKKKDVIIEKSHYNHKSITNIHHDLNNINENKKEIDFDNDYYKVNTNKIKFMIYDFTQEMAINNNNKEEKKSQMEIIKENYKAKNNINISEDINYPNISIEKFSKDLKNKKIKNSEISNKRNNIQKENYESKKIFDKEKEFEKEIAYALSKQDEQKPIIFFYQVSFIFSIIMLLMAFLEIYFIINNSSSLIENIKLLIDSTNLKYVINIGIYLIREKNLFSIYTNSTHIAYKIPHSDPDTYILQINNLTKEIFMEGNTNLEYIIGTNLKLCDNSTYILTEKLFDIEIIYTNSITRNVTSSFYSSILHIYSSFCNLLSKSDEVSNDDPNLYNFIHNSFNNLGNMLNLQIELFETELTKREYSIMINIIIYSVIFLILHLFIYFIIYKAYFSIVKKKASYISVFYGIGLSLIRSSIKKCEIFLNKINQDEDNAKIKEIDEYASSFISSIGDNNLNKTFMENNFERKSINISKTIKKPKKVKQKRNIGDDKKSKQFKFIYRLILFFSILYLIIIFVVFLKFIQQFINCGTYIFNMQNYHNNILELFNAYREYLFDEKTIVYGLPSYDYLIKKEELFYLTNTENKNILTVLSKNIRGLYNNSLFIKEQGFCKNILSYFNSEKECLNYIGGENGIISLGFDLLINYFIEEIRNQEIT